MDILPTTDKKKTTIFLILFVAAVFYFWHLSRPDIITDESSYAVRAIGMVDFDFGIEQPTPWQWVEKIPPWMRLSFHDHPPLVFLLQHYSIRLFGETPFAVRLPSVLAGLASIVLVYLIGKQLYQPVVGLAAAALFAFTVNHVWISRIGLQESIAIAFMLASAYFFLRGLQNPRWFMAAGALLGLAFLAKYYILILVPIFVSLLFVSQHSIYAYDRKHVWSWRFWLALTALFIAVASPVIIYNIQLYRNFGHFDFQFSQLFGQEVKEWPSRPGQEVLGSYGERMRAYLPRLIESNSPYFLALAAIGLATVLIQLVRRRGLVISHSSLVIVFLWLLPFLILIGPAHRFLTLLTPWLAIAAGYAIVTLIRERRAAIAVVAALVIIEALYAYNSVIALDPIGSRPWAYSYLRRQANSWGFNELNDYLDAELAGKMPDPAITFEFPFASEILKQAVADGRQRKLQPVSAAIVYNDNINLSSQLWVFLRRIIYQGWPVVSAENFRRGGAVEFLRSAGVKRVYFINATEAALQDRTRPPTPDGDIMETELGAEGLRPREIKNPRGEVVFKLYEFELK
ncbi:MAG: glycosyltransferase family 39 protein [Candidatus Sungbacteria bacterium]|uniref:Glycosyltransferase family 39 protein n=1 Tax=Candidatus Sungiibacteriota bacterium TaxID=2750080 RepID=A0A933DSW3_9BACT|nr:glycosyltransferase family 39 protein [Candidatus Sungbacteria bacterium]MBI4132267.1 glycosyltransferase family 39 protein [Candidatus Sungbacteria bacterium]